MFLWYFQTWPNGWVWQKIRMKIVYAYKQGDWHTTFSKCLNVPRSTIRSIIKNYEETHSFEKKIRTVRKRLITERMKRKIVREYSLTLKVHQNNINKNITNSNLKPKRYFFIFTIKYSIMLWWQKGVKHLMYILSKTQDRKCPSYLKNNFVDEFRWPPGNCISKVNKNRIKFLHQEHKHYINRRRVYQLSSLIKICWIKGKYSTPTNVSNTQNTTYYYGTK